MVVWYFALDGLPEESHKYRINQDGQTSLGSYENGCRDGIVK